MAHPCRDGFSEYRWPLPCSFSGDDDATTPRPRLKQPTTPLSSPPGRFAGLNPSKVRRRSIASSVRSRSKSTPGTVVPHVGTVSLGAPVVDRSVPFLYMGNGNAPPRMVNRGAAIQPARGTAGQAAPSDRIAARRRSFSTDRGSRRFAFASVAPRARRSRTCSWRDSGAGVSSGRRPSHFRGAT